VISLHIHASHKFTFNLELGLQNEAKLGTYIFRTK
jgi:hypothetical protein